MTRASCNRILWNRQSSKTRANHPCLGCTEPGFPHHDLKERICFQNHEIPWFFTYKKLPPGEPKLFYWFKAGVGKVLGSPDSAKQLRESAK